MIGENISLAKGTPLEKSNAVFEKIIRYIAGNKDFLENEGVFRLPGEKGLVDAAYVRVEKDPSAWIIENEGAELLMPNNVSGLLKRFALTEKQWSPEAAAILMLELESERDQIDDPIDLHDVIQQLIAKNHLEEAKMLHNALHLAHLVASKSDHNKMPAANMFQTMGPWLATMANGDDSTFMKLAVAAAAATQSKADTMGLTKTKPNGEPLYGKTFNETYPEAAQKLVQAHADIPKRSSKKVGFKLPKILKTATDWVRNTAVPAVNHFFTKTIPGWFSRFTGSKAKAQSVNAVNDSDKLAVPPELIAAREQAEQARRQAEVQRQAQAQREAQAAIAEQMQREREAQLQGMLPPKDVANPHGLIDVPPPTEPPPPPPDQLKRAPTITPGKFTEEEKTAMQRVKKEALSFFRDLEQKVENKVLQKPKDINKK